MKRNKSGFIKESFEVEIDYPFGSFLCDYEVLAYKQDADRRCTDSDWDYRGYTEINSVIIHSLQCYNEDIEDYQEITLDALSVEVANEIIQKVHDDAVVKINEGIGG
jgi:hypothetical protein